MAKHTHNKFGGMIDCLGCHPKTDIKSILSTIGYAIMMLVAIDIFILMVSLAQIGIEDRTGYWSPFWLAQAKAVMWLLQ